MGSVLWFSFALRLLLGLVRGVGLVMIIPLLYVGGVLEGTVESGILSDITRSLEAMGVNFGLESVLFSFVVGIGLFAWLKRLSSLLDARIWQSYVKDVQKEVYYSLSFANWSYLLRAKSSDVVHVLTHDVAMVSSGVRQSLTCLSFLMVGLVNFIVALFISWQMTILVTISGGILWLILKPLNRKSVERGASQRGFQRNLFAEITQNMGAIKLIKSSGKEGEANTSFSCLVEAMHEDMLLFQRLRENALFIYEIVGAVFLSIFIYVALQWGGAEPAALLMLIYLFVRLIPLVSLFQQNWQLVMQAQPSYDAYCELIRDLKANEEPLLEEDASVVFELKEAIRGECIDFAYESSRSSVLSGINFVISANRMTALVGPSGRGKTTLSDIVIGLLVPDSGKVLIDGIELTEISRGAWRKRVAYVAQETFLFHDTIRANLQWAKPDANDEEMFQALDRFAGGFVRDLPNGLDTIVGERGAQLSGGECQRIALSRALLGDPLLLVLDEATNALDAENERIILEALQGMRGHITILLVTHNKSIWAAADHVIEV